MRPWPLLVLLAACSPGERPFVAAAPPPNPVAGRLVVRTDGAFAGLEACSENVVIDAPARILMRDLVKALRAALDGGAKELAVLVDTSVGEGAIPLRIPVDTSGLGYTEKGRIRMLWRLGQSPETPGARVHPGFDGAYTVVETGPARVLLIDLWEKPGGGKPDQPTSFAVPSIEEARFILLSARPGDTLRDVLHSLLALERRFPGIVVLDVLTK